MENLVGRKVKCVRRFSNMTIGKIYKTIKYQDNYIYVIKDNGVLGAYDIDFFDGSGFELLPNEPQFKQGDKVLFTDDLVNWEEGIFLVKHDESYIIESDEMLLYAIEIKPYEEEIKIGDWVKSELNDCVFKYQFGRLKDDLTKITDEVLINKLNEL